MPGMQAITQPPPLARGGHIRVICPAWPAVFYASGRAERAAAALTDLGFTVSYGANAAEVTDDGVSAGTAQQRAQDFMDAVLDPTVDAILSAGGGSTSWEVLPLLDAEAIREHPKPFIGHCDNVWINQFLLQEAGLVSYSGVAFTGHFGEPGGVMAETLASFLAVVCADGPVRYEPALSRTNEDFNWQDPDQESLVRNRNVAGGWHWVRPGRGSGRLVGGDSRMLLYLLDHFDLSLAGAVLFWEVGHPDPELGGALVTGGTLAELLRRMSKRVDLTKLAGLIIGPYVHIAPDDWARMVDGVITEVLGEVSFPVLVNGDIGQLHPSWVLPYGELVVLDSTDGVYVPRAAR